ncbi:hypothetical protein AAGW05_16750 [Arthrobacter sp. LAPM80]|uniref:hypothetical protein n=1 Tax=Arthrobacter sp. LAPM80 TaxID=3141788 RepID=UPI00398B0D27
MSIAITSFERQVIQVCDSTPCGSASLSFLIVFGCPFFAINPLVFFLLDSSFQYFVTVTLAPHSFVAFLGAIDLDGASLFEFAPTVHTIDEYGSHFYNRCTSFSTSTLPISVPI